MADFNALTALINAYIKQNGVKAITGQILNGVLRGMVSALGKGYTVAGEASPTTDPGTMTGPVAYIAHTAGTYEHFGNLVVAQGEVAMLIYDEAVWRKDVLLSLSANATVDANVGTPEVTCTFVDGVLTFDFRNMKGNPGDAAGFGAVTATVDANVGTPGVSVQTSGPDTAKNITFQFTNLKGETGVTSCVVTVDNTTGTPSCAVSLVGQELHLDFSGLKGAQGNTGSSVDYPFEIVNNLTTNDATKALSAAMGVQLESEVSQLEAEVDGLNMTASGSRTGAGWLSIELPNELVAGKKYTLVFTKSVNMSGVAVSTSTSSSSANRVDIDIVKLDYYAQNTTTLSDFIPSGNAKFLLCWCNNNVQIDVNVTSGGISDSIENITEDISSLSEEIVAMNNNIEDRLTEKNDTPSPSFYDGFYMLNGTIQKTEGGQYALAVLDISDIVGIEGTISVDSQNVNNNYINLWGIYERIEVGQSASIAGPMTATKKTDSLAIPSLGKYLAVQCLSSNHTVTVGYVLEILSKLQKEIDDLQPEEREQIEVSLPDKIYAVVGDTLQLFYRGIVRAVDVSKYDIQVVCTKGLRYGRYFEYTPVAGDVGTVSFQINVQDDFGNVVGTKTCELVTVASPVSPASSKKILCFGDSLTNEGIWCAEADRRLTGSGGTPVGKGLSNLTFCGSRRNENTGYFGAGGWTWYNYTIKGESAFRFQVSGVTSIGFRSVYSNNGHNYTVEEVNIVNGVGNILCKVSSASDTPTSSGTLTKVSGNGDATINFTSVEADVQNPLWDLTNNKMSFVPYANEYSGGAIDAVYVLLTWNGLSPFKTDFSSMMNSVKTFADTLHSEFPSAKLKIMGIQVPNQKDMHEYGANGGYSDMYGMTFTAFMLNKAYQEFANQDGYSTWVEFVNVSSQFDSDYNMQVANKAVNTRNSDTEVVGANGVHPATSGYMQIADVAYRNIVANFCQS